MPNLGEEDTEQREIEDVPGGLSIAGNLCELTHPMTNGPNDPPGLAVNIALTPASLNATICSSDSLTPGGGPLMMTNLFYAERGGR